jgi:hypothetical protein
MAYWRLVRSAAHGDEVCEPASGRTGRSIDDTAWTKAMALLGDYNLEMTDPARQQGEAEPAEQRVSRLGAELSQLAASELLRVLVRLPPHALARALELVLREPRPAANQSPPAAAPAPVPAPAERSRADRRKEGRAKTLRGAKIVFNNKMCVVDCVVRDMSSKGCLIRTESTSNVPRCFSLHIVNGDAWHECEVVWRDQKMLGVTFIS